MMHTCYGLECLDVVFCEGHYGSAVFRPAPSWQNLGRPFLPVRDVSRKTACRTVPVLDSSQLPSLCRSGAEMPHDGACVWEGSLLPPETHPPHARSNGNSPNFFQSHQENQHHERKRKDVSGQPVRSGTAAILGRSVSGEVREGL
uniref:Uncharacterized protein n=1 Tax=Burkholderia sp. M701 TaxID=326454 RepID=V5YP87_9BURK|nr:hypothetical protein [Burkholderia sp. M701]